LRYRFFVAFPSFIISWTLRAITSTDILEEGYRDSVFESQDIRFRLRSSLTR
jgi:hypothetical protein